MARMEEGLQNLLLSGCLFSFCFFAFNGYISTHRYLQHICSWLLHGHLTMSYAFLEMITIQ